MMKNTQLGQQIIPENFISQKSAKGKCSLPACNKDHCTTPWHNPCILAKSDLADRLQPLLVVVGTLEIIIGIIFNIIIVEYADNYDILYGTEDSKGISLACLTGSIILWLTACLLIISIHWRLRRLMLIYIFISTILGIYIFVLSVIKMQYGLSMIEEDSNMGGCSGRQNFLSSAPCLLCLLTLLGSAVHFIGNIVVFAYYNLKYLQPSNIKCGDVT